MINIMPFLLGEMLPTDEYKFALYAGTPPTIKYRKSGEVVAVGYDQGGKILNSPTYGKYERGAWVNFSGKLVWQDATISASGGIIYNVRTGTVVTSITFDEVISSTNHEFVVELRPDSDPLISITYQE